MSERRSRRRAGAVPAAPVSGTQEKILRTVTVFPWRAVMREHEDLVCVMMENHDAFFRDEQNRRKERPANTVNGNQKSFGHLKGAKTIAR